MKIGFYNPYFDSMSGGERYVLTLASHWSKSHDVFLFWDDQNIITASQQRLNIDLTKVHTVENIFKTNNLFKKLAVSRGFDMIFFLTDGSIPATFAAHNILHFQVPFQKVSTHPIKLALFQTIVCNSHFTKDHVDPTVGKRSVVIYPPVEPIQNLHTNKKNMILSVGRFHSVKKQNVLIDIFKQGSNVLKGFELVLAGGLQPVDTGYFESLKKQALGLPIRFFPNVPFDTLTKLYNDARIYWHAAGFGETKPEQMEHFGITTVEAMSVGCIPIVFNGGGQPEIVQKYLWNTPDECLLYTLDAIKSKIEKPVFPKKFSVEIFTHTFDDLLNHITG